MGSDDQAIYALDAATGRVLWRGPTGGAVSSSPAVVDGLVVIGSADGSLYIIGGPEPGVEVEDVPPPSPPAEATQATPQAGAVPAVNRAADVPAPAECRVERRTFESLRSLTTAGNSWRRRSI